MLLNSVSFAIRTQYETKATVALSCCHAAGDFFIAKIILHKTASAADRRSKPPVYIVYFQYVCVIIAAIILYLLTKIIIEKNERPIAMVKILGYEDGEIARLYLLTTAVVVMITELIAMVLGYYAMNLMWEIMLQKLGGYFAFIMKPDGFVKEFVLVTAAYLVITVFDFIRIRRIPKVLALKNAE